MKKMIIAVLVSSFGVSLYGAEWKGEFKELLLKSVVSKEESSVEELKIFINDRKEYIGETDLSQVKIEGYGTVKSFIGDLDPRFFSNKEALWKCFLPKKAVPQFDQGQPMENTVVSCIYRILNPSIGMNSEYDFPLIEFVYNQCKINIDEDKHNRQDLNIGWTLDSELGRSGADSEYGNLLERVKGLVGGNRTAALEANKRARIFTSAIECLCEEKTADELSEILKKDGDIDSETKKRWIDYYTSLNADVFPKRNDVILAFDPSVTPSEPENDSVKAGNDTAEMLVEALKDKDKDPLLVKMVCYAIQIRGIKIPLCYYPYDETHNLARALLDSELKVPGRDAFEDVIDVAVPVNDALLTLAKKCLMEEKEVSELEDFLKQFGGLMKLDIEYIWNFVEHKTDIFERREKVLAALQPDREISSNNVDANWYIRRSLMNDCDLWMADCATYAYKKFPVNLDKLPLDDKKDWGTCGQKLDAQLCAKGYLAENPLVKFSKLVRGDRWATPTNDPEGIQFRTVLVKALCKKDDGTKDEDTEEQLCYYLKCMGCSIPAAEETMLVGKYANDGYAKTYGALFDQLSSNLFPNKQSVQDLIMSDEYKAKSVTWDQDADSVCIKSLAVVSLDNPELFPLVQYGYKVYIDRYKTEIDFAGLKYNDTTFGEYVAKQDGHALSGFLPTAAPNNPNKLSSKPSKAVLESPNKNETNTSTPFWKKALGVGIVGAIVYGLYKYRSRPDREADEKLSLISVGA